MNKVFLIDRLSELRITYDRLILDLNEAKTYKKYIKTDSYYEILLNILLTLIIEKEIILLDDDFSEEEIIALIGSANLKSFTEDIRDHLQIKNLDHLIDVISHVSNDWKITLFTSGTTGAPKKVSHSFKNITRFVKISEKQSNSIWGFAYNPTHIAGIQVFLQALLNKNPIVRLFNLNSDLLFNEIIDHKVSHISATPTFYRLMVPTKYICPSVLRITFGGERFDVSTLNHLKSSFPNAKMNNIYASTEAGSLLVSDGDLFTLNSTNERLFKIFENELYICQDFLGFSDEIMVKNGWYATGDLVEIVENNPIRFRFVSRKNEMINVGGYKVNPAEVEETIRSITGVKDVVVFSKLNSVLGSTVCCYIVLDRVSLSEKFIRSELQKKLQEYKIPRLMKFVDSIEMTRTGKVKR